MRKTVLFLILVSLVVSTVHAQETSIINHPEVASNIQLLEAWIESQMAYKGWPGISIGIVYDQELIWSRGFGYADQEKEIPATPDTIYRIASISKLFTSIAIMKLCDEGKLQLDDPVEKHLSWFKIKNEYKDTPVITIRHLLSHTSGLPREAAFPYWTDYKFPSRNQMIEALQEQETIYPSETKWKYSNLALSLAGEVVAAVSGDSYADYIHQHILKPLGMESTSVILSEEHQSRLAIGYGRRMPDGSRQVMPFTDAKGITPAAGLSSTVNDFARFASWQFKLREPGEHKILKSSTLIEMHRIHWLNPDWASGWGLGFDIIHREMGDIVGHGGWVSGYQTAVYLSPKEKVAAIVLTNADDTNPYVGSPFSIIDKVFEWIAPAITKAVEIPEDNKVDPAWASYVGKYRDKWGDYQVLIMNGKLWAINPTELDPLASKLSLVPIAEYTFKIEGEGYDALGELVVFEMGSEGEVVRVKWGENYLNPQMQMSKFPDMSNATSDIKWYEDFELAKKIAAQEGKDLLINFTGSDWCVWCWRLSEEVFDLEHFKTEAPKKFVLVKLDFPRNPETKQDPEIKAQNGKLLVEFREKYQFTGYPNVYLANAKGIPYAKTGYQAGGPEKYMEHLAELVKTRPLENPIPLRKLSFGAMTNQGLGYISQGNPQKAKPLLEEALKVSMETLGDEHLNTLTAMHNVGWLYINLRRYDEALSLNIELQEKELRILGEDSRLTLRTLSNIGWTYFNMGRFEEAVPVYIKALEGRSRVLGADHPDALKMMSNLARVYLNLGHYEEAKPLFVKAVEGRRRVLGKYHPSTLITAFEHGILYYKQGNYDQAEQLFTETLLGKRQVEPDEFESMKRLAWLQATYPNAKFRDGDSAVKYAIEACELTNWKDSACMYILSAAYAESGDLAAAVKYQQKALELLDEDADEETRAAYEAGLKLYQSGKPYREAKIRY